MKGKKKVLKTSEDWLGIKRFRRYYIIDPDGWDRCKFTYSFFEEKISEKEFSKRLMASTIFLRAL